MGIRISLSILFLFGVTAVADATPYTIIPPITVKPKVSYKSLTSGPKSLISRKDIQASGVTSLAEALQNLGGVQLQDLTGNSSQVLLSMRGFGANASSNTLFLVNGVPITNPDMAPPDLNSIPIDEIEMVEIIAGTESVLYGDQAVGGAINVITKHHSKNKWMINCNTGSYDQYGCSINWQETYKNIISTISLLKNHTDNYRDHNDYDQNRLIGNFDFAYPAGDFSLDFNLVDENMQYPGALTAAQVHQDRQQSTNESDFFHDKSGYLHFSHQRYLASGWQLETDAALRRMNGDGFMFSSFTQTRAIYFIKPQLKGNIGQNTVTGGIDLESDAYHLNSAFGVTDEDQQKYSLFALTNIPVRQKLTFSIGARGAELLSHLRSTTVDNNINRALATTLGGTYELNPSVKIYLRRAESFRFPKADENANVPNGVTSLRTQRGVSYETGIEVNQENYTSKIGIYQLNLRDEIAFDPMQTALQPFGSNRNLDPTIRRGITLSGKYKITHQLSIDSQYNYVNARYQTGPNANNRIPLVSENIFRAGADYHFKPHLNMYAEGIFTGNQFPANDDANTIGKNGGYMVYNLNFRYEYEKFSAALRFNNIFNKYYYFYTVLQQETEYFYPAPGGNFTLTMSYTID